MARYFLNIGTDTNSTANWSNTSGGAGGFSVPTSTDDVFFDANSGPAILTATFDCLSLNTTGFTGTIDINSRLLRMQGSLTLSATTVITRTTGTIQIQGSSSPLTVTTNGVNLPYIGFQGSGITYNLAGNINCDVLTISNPCTINNNNIYVSTTLLNVAISSGTTVIEADGTTTLSSTFPTNIAVIINSTSAITFSGVCAFRNLTYTTAASVTTTGSTLSAGNNNCSWNTNGIIWDNVLIGAGAVTLGSDFRYTGTLTAATANTAAFNGAYNVYLGAALTTGGGGSGLGGTATLVCDGTTTWASTGSAGVKMNFNVISTANLTISGSVYYGTSTLTVDPAANLVTTSSTFYLSGNCTLNTNSKLFNIVDAGAAFTITINSLLSATTLNTRNGTLTFQGTAGFTVANLVLVEALTVNRTYTLKSGLTYTVNSSCTLVGNLIGNLLFKSSVATSPAYFNLAYGASQNMRYIQATDIDSSGGQTIMAGVNSTLLRTINWQLTEGNWWLVLNRA